MGQLGMQELIVIFVIALLVFGPRKLPELGKSLGKGLREFKRATNELKSTWDDQLKDVDREVRETTRDLRNVERDFKKDLDADEASSGPKTPSAPTAAAAPAPGAEPARAAEPAPRAPSEDIGQGSIKAPADEDGAPEPEPVTSEAAEVQQGPADEGKPPSGNPA